MGYYTEHYLTVRKIRNNEQFLKLSNCLKEKDLIGYAFNDGDYDTKKHEAYFTTYDAVKWYKHSADMIMFSEQFPNMYFMLEGIGEEFGDFWREFYHDGDVEECRGEIVYEQPKKVQWNDLIRF